jgi:hypothetical protein
MPANLNPFNVEDGFRCRAVGLLALLLVSLSIYFVGGCYSIFHHEAETVSYVNSEFGSLPDIVICMPDFNKYPNMTDAPMEKIWGNGPHTHKPSIFKWSVKHAFGEKTMRNPRNLSYLSKLYTNELYEVFPFMKRGSQGTTTICYAANTSAVKTSEWDDPVFAELRIKMWVPQLSPDVRHIVQYRIEAIGRTSTNKFTHSTIAWCPAGRSSWNPQWFEVRKKMRGRKGLFKTWTREVFTGRVSASMPSLEHLFGDRPLSGLNATPLFINIKFTTDVVDVALEKSKWISFLDLLSRVGGYTTFVGMIYGFFFVTKYKHLQDTTFRGHEEPRMFAFTALTDEESPFTALTDEESSEEVELDNMPKPRLC